MYQFAASCSSLHFAHLAIGCLRSLGLAARYVSGYLETAPPPGEERLIGADASHAWPSVFIPGWGWLDIDPTNDQIVRIDVRHHGLGRDYSDVSPLKGIVFGGGDSIPSTSRSTSPARRSWPVAGAGSARRRLIPLVNGPTSGRATGLLLDRMRILITGAARAIGAATADELTRAGHEVVATARDPSLLAGLDVACGCLSTSPTRNPSAGPWTRPGTSTPWSTTPPSPARARWRTFPVERLRAHVRDQHLRARSASSSRSCSRPGGPGAAAWWSTSARSRAGSPPPWRAPTRPPSSRSKACRRRSTTSSATSGSGWSYRARLHRPGHEAGRPGPGPSCLPQLWEGVGRDRREGDRTGRSTRAGAGGRRPSAAPSRTRPPRSGCRWATTPYSCWGPGPSLDDASFEAAMRTMLGITW